MSDISRYGLHGLRAGGASAAANHGVPDRLFKRHGRWRSENAKDGYVRDELNERLKVSQVWDYNEIKYSENVVSVNSRSLCLAVDPYAPRQYVVRCFYRMRFRVFKRNVINCV